MHKTGYAVLGVLTAVAIAGIFLHITGNKEISVQNKITADQIPNAQHTIEDNLILEKTTKQLPDFNQTRDVVISSKGSYGIYIKYFPNVRFNSKWGMTSGDVSDSVVFEINPAKKFFGASLFKTPIAIAYMSSNFSLEDEYAYLPADYSDGTGDLNQQPYGTKLKASELLSKLLKKSDNSAQNLLTRVLGWQNIEPTFKKLGLPYDFYTQNYLTPVDGTKVFEGFITADLEGASYLLDLMDKTDFDNRIDLGLDSRVMFAHKIGTSGALFHDCGLATGKNGSAVVCLLSEGSSESEFKTVAQTIGAFINQLLVE